MFRFYVAPNGSSNRFDAGPAFFAGLGSSWSMQIETRRIHSANNSIIFDAGNAGGASRFYWLIEPDGDVLMFMQGSSRTFGNVASFDDWTRLHAKCTSGAIEMFSNGTKLGTTWGAPTLNASSHDRTLFLSNYFGTSGYFGGDVASFKIWNSAQDHDTTATPDYSEWDLQFSGGPAINDLVSGMGPYDVVSADTSEFFRHEHGRISGRKQVYPYISCGNVQGTYPLNINNIGTVNGWQWLWDQAQIHVDAGADGFYNLLPFSRAKNEPSVISGDAARDLLYYTATGELDDFSPRAIFPGRYTAYATDFLVRNPTKGLVIYLGGPSRDVTLKPLYRGNPARWASRMNFELAWFKAITTGKLEHQRHRMAIHVDLTGGAQGSRADLEEDSPILKFYQELAGHHPFGVEPLPGIAARHLFGHDNISTWSAFTGANSVYLPEYTGNVFVLIDNDSNAETRIDTAAAHTHVTHLVVPPGKLAYALNAVGAI